MFFSVELTHFNSSAAEQVLAGGVVSSGCLCPHLSVSILVPTCMNAPFHECLRELLHIWNKPAERSRILFSEVIGHRSRTKPAFGFTAQELPD